MNRYKVTYIQLFLAALLVLPILFLIRDMVEAVSNEINAVELDEAANCRYGVASFSDADYNFLQDLGVGWSLNFAVRFTQNLPSGVDYAPVIRFEQVIVDGVRQPEVVFTYNTPPLTDEPDGLGPVIAANLGKLWLVGNEVDRIGWQDDTMPDVYAMAYHDIYHFIKERDPSAQIAISGLVEVTPGRLQYLDLVWESYLEKYGTPMPVDVWNMHIYILPEIKSDGTDSNAAVALGTDPAIAYLESGSNASLCSLENVYCMAEHDDMDIFAGQVVAMRQWMKDHGQQYKPLILSEFSLLYETDLIDEYGNDFNLNRGKQFMLNTFDYLETAVDPNIGYPMDNDRLVQQWLWFAVSGDDLSPNRLLESNGATYQTTLIGETFLTEMNNLPPFTANTFIHRASYPTAETILPGGTVSATIAAQVYNNGNTLTTTPVTVTFYSDALLTQQIGSAVIPAGLGGCARHMTQVEVVWDNLDAGVHDYWVALDGGNTVSGYVIINPEEVFLPLISR